MTVFIHETAIVDDGAQIGKDTRIWHWAHVCSGAVIGSKCSLGQNVFVGNKATIGNNVKIQNNVSVYDDVVLEDDVFCGPSMVFTNVYNPRSAVERKSEYKNTLIKKGATLVLDFRLIPQIENLLNIQHQVIGFRTGYTRAHELFLFVFEGR